MITFYVYNVMADVLEKYSLKELLHIDFRSKIGREIKNKSQLSVKEIKTYIKNKKRENEYKRKDVIAKLNRLNDNILGEKLIGYLKIMIIKWKRKQYGPAYLNISKCTNVEDFCTLDKLDNIPKKNFFSILENGVYYGFDINSLIQMQIANKNKKLINPYTMNPFQNEVVEIIKKKSIHFKHSDIPKTIRNEVFRLFEVIDSFGYCTNLEWFFDLNMHMLKKWYSLGEDLWNYRAQLSFDQKRAITPKGVFNEPIRNITKIKKLEHMQKVVLNQIDALICHRKDVPTRTLGCIYVLTIFTELNPKIAQAFPGIPQVYY